jgi:thiol:disulfide interchange protein
MRSTATSPGSTTKRVHADRLRRFAVSIRSSVAGASALVGFAVLAAGIGAVRADVKLLPPEEAFQFSARALDPGTIEALFTIADGYYMYRDRFRFSVEPTAVLAAPQLPAGKVKDDPFFGRVETYRKQVSVRVSLANAAPGQSLTIRAESQGCADAGVCYPPHAQAITLSLPKAGGPPGPLIDAVAPKKRWFN